MGVKLNTVLVIKYSAYETLHNGYVKRSDNESNCTADKVFNAISEDVISESELLSVKDRVANWMQFINDSTGEYFDNIRTEISKPTIDENKIGLIASSFSCMDKTAKYIKSNDLEKSSEYLGEVGDTVNFEIKSYMLLKSGTSKFDNHTSSKWFLYKINDTNNNVIKWFADHNCEFEFTHSKRIKAVISKLSVYKDVKQTNITRVNFLD